jgi:hypothetical protein
MLLFGVAWALHRKYNKRSNAIVSATKAEQDSARNLMVLMECGVAQIQSNRSYPGQTQAEPHTDLQEDVVVEGPT